MLTRASRKIAATAAKRQFAVGRSASPSSRLFSTATVKKDDIASAKPCTEVPHDWKGTLPIISSVPLFLPYVEKEAGGVRMEQFHMDYYEKFGKETGITRIGTASAQAFLVYDEGFLQLHKKEGKYPPGILEGSWPIQQYNDKHVDGIQNPFTQNGEAWRQGRMAVNPYIFNKKKRLHIHAYRLEF